ncbi:hypothetical protein [Azospirillum argentinense]|uniref:Uncharacterized protein n=1 Tax=Azospirillum argentinense TaxID=2970906 RepID=A0A5B0KSX5_9PROT|nr:hypothetical protein [Azospirillum argentinense]KAA1053904.1 hypothetical protein FH063_002486 [Azospirillum argentinense]
MSILPEIFIVSLVALLAISGLVIFTLNARLRSIRRWHNSYVQEAWTEVRSRDARIETIRAMRWVYRDIWDHLTDHLPMSEDRANLAWTLGTSVVHIEPLGAGPRTPLTHLEWRHLHDAEISQLVARVNDPVLTALWAEQSFWSVHEMLRVLLFQCWDPAYDGHKGWGGVTTKYGLPCPHREALVGTPSGSNGNGTNLPEQPPATSSALVNDPLEPTVNCQPTGHLGT